MATVGAQQLQGIAQAGMQGIQTGMDYAKTKQTMELQREKFQMEKESLEQQKKMQKMAIGYNIIDELQKATNDEYSGKVRQKYVEQARQKADIMEVNIKDEAFVAALGDPDQAQKIATVNGIIRNAAEAGNDEFASEMLGDLMDMVGSENALEMYDQIYKRQDAFKAQIQERLAKQQQKREERAFEMKKLERKEEFALEGEERQRKFTRKRQLEQDMDSIRKEVKQIDTEYAPAFRGLEGIRQVARDPRGLANPVTRDSLVESFKALVDPKAGVIREAEKQSLINAASYIDQIGLRIEKLGKGASIPEGIATGIIDAMQTAERAIYIAKADRLSASLRSLKSRGLMDRADAVLGENLDIIRKGQYYKAINSATDRKNRPLTFTERKAIADKYGVAAEKYGDESGQKNNQ